MVGGPCIVTVTVTECPGTISVDYPVIGLASDNGYVPIMWRFSANSVKNVKFAQDGIAFKPQSDQFINGVLTSSGSGYLWIGVNSDRYKAYTYGIRVMQGSTQCAYVDPTVVNE